MSLPRRSAFFGATLMLAELAWGCAPGIAGSSCNSDFDCGSGFYCSSSGVCQQSSVICASFENCGENQICASGVCVNGCRMDGCPSGQTCNRSLDQCVTLLVDEGDSGTSGGQGSTAAGESTSGTTGGGTTTYGGSTTAAATAGAASSTTGTSTGSTGGSASSTGRATSSTSASSTGTTTGGAACTADTWANFAGTFFKAYCNECHNWTQATVANDRSVAIEMKAGFMPPRRNKQPSAQNLNRILTWIGCGEP